MFVALRAQRGAWALRLPWAGPGVSGSPFCSAFRPGVLSRQVSNRARASCHQPDRDNLARADYLHPALGPGPTTTVIDDRTSDLQMFYSVGCGVWLVKWFVEQLVKQLVNYYSNSWSNIWPSRCAIAIDCHPRPDAIAGLLQAPRRVRAAWWLQR